MTKDKLEKLLKEHFAPQYIFVADDSHLHAGHAQALESGGGHFSIIIVSEKFDHVPLVKRHQMIYTLLKDHMQQAIHALAIKAWTPQEYKQQN